MVAAFSYLIVGRYSNSRAIFLGIELCYVVISVFALLGKKWATGVSVVVALLLMLRWLPMASINTWMFVTGHELYRDSPATILVVISYGVVFAIPATVLSILYALHWKNIWKTVRYGA